MLNDVIFNDEISAFNDWNVILTKSEIPFPQIKKSTIDIKGADGELDLSEVLTGDVKYSNREIKLTFEMLDDAEYPILMSKIGAYVHGKKVSLQFSNDDLYYYVGRATISSWECVKRKGKIVISIDCDPYKYRVNDTIVNVNVSGENTVILTNERKRVCPTLSVQGTITMTYNGLTYELENGVYRIPTFHLVEGGNIVNLKGNGSIKFTYRMGAL